METKAFNAQYVDTEQQANRPMVGGGRVKTLLF